MKDRLTKVKFIFIVTLMIIYGCRGQTNDYDRCYKYLNKARKSFNELLLGKENKEIKVDSLISATDIAIECPATRMAAVELKCSILIRWKKYKEGYEFVESLKQEDFKLPYKKQLYWNYFHAYECEANIDTIGRNRYLNSIIKNVSRYILEKNTHSNEIDKEAYYDLFFIKSRVLSSQEFDGQLNILMKKFPNDKEFLEALKSTFYSRNNVTIMAQ